MIIQFHWAVGNLEVDWNGPWRKALLKALQGTTRDLISVISKLMPQIWARKYCMW